MAEIVFPFNIRAFWSAGKSTAVLGTGIQLGTQGKNKGSSSII